MSAGRQIAEATGHVHDLQALVKEIVERLASGVTVGQSTRDYWRAEAIALGVEFDADDDA